MSDHTTSGTLSQGLVPFALALKLMQHELSMSLTAEAHVNSRPVAHVAAAQTVQGGLWPSLADWPSNLPAGDQEL
jgi:hypothetical protein